MHMPQHRLLVVGLFAIGFVLSLASSRAAAQTYTDLYDFDVTHGSQPWGSALAQGRDGNLYSTAGLGGANNSGVFFMITPGGAINVLYNFEYGYAPSGGVTLGTDGNFYGVSASGGTFAGGIFFKVTPKGG